MAVVVELRGRGVYKLHDDIQCVPFLTHLLPCCHRSFFSPTFSSVPAVPLISTVYTTVVRARGCACVREAGE